MTTHWNIPNGSIVRCLSDLTDDSTQPPLPPAQSSKYYYHSPIPNSYQLYEPNDYYNWERYYDYVGHRPHYYTHGDHLPYHKAYKHMRLPSDIDIHHSTKSYDHPGKVRVHSPTYHFNSSHPKPTKSENMFVEVADDRDVLCGRGAPTAWHIGNQYFRKLVKDHQKEYLASRRSDKPLIAMKLLEDIKSRGGRFLKRNKLDGIGARGHFVWIEISEQQAYEKVCQALREGAPKIRQQIQKLKISQMNENASSQDSSTESRIHQ